MKRLFSVVMVTIIAMSLVACGKDAVATSESTTSSIEYSDSDTDTDDFQGEGEIQGGIKSDEELEALAEEEQYEEETEEMLEAGEAANVDMEGHEPDGIGSGNFQDYWEGDDYFDLVRYLTDNGYELVVPCERFNCDTIEDGETADLYWCQNEDEHGWIVIVWGTGAGDGGFDVFYLEDYDPYYSVSSCDGRKVAVDNTGMFMTEGNIAALNSIVEALKTNGDSIDPLEETGLSYIQLE